MVPAAVNSPQTSKPLHLSLDQTMLVCTLPCITAVSQGHADAADELDDGLIIY